MAEIAEMDPTWAPIRLGALKVTSAGDKVTAWGRRDDGLTVRAQHLQGEDWVAVSLTPREVGRPVRTGLLMREVPDYARVRLNDLVRQLQGRLGEQFDESLMVRQG
ncbi:hypothetical protein [Streptomyces alanosinicus]|nr:hypothetical protein [Streptomyces alanosinicus]